MTYNINGFGTKVRASRPLTLEEYNVLKDKLPYSYQIVYRKSIVTFDLIIPIIPLYTLIYVDILTYRNKDGNKVRVLDRRDLYRDLHTDIEREFAWTNWSLKKGVNRLFKYTICLKLPIDWNFMKSQPILYFSPTMLPLLILYRIGKSIRDKKVRKEASHATSAQS
jgi:hypothetical protein